ncbi:MAG: ComF family protein [Micropepsaceae bacterium]
MQAGSLARLGRIGRWAADALFPPQCPSCAAPTGSPSALCLPCWEKAGFGAPACRRCAIPLDSDLADETAECAACIARPPAYSRARAAMTYEGGRDMVLRYKHGERTDFTPAFAAWMVRAGASVLEGADMLAPVPLHRWRLLARRYNQSALLANAIGRLSGVASLPDALVRTRATPSQGAMVSAWARRRNVLAAFAVRAGVAEAVKGRVLVLVDDVMTTGATLEAAARALRRAGAAEVRALVLARVVRPGEAPIF